MCKKTINQNLLIEIYNSDCNTFEDIYNTFEITQSQIYMFLYDNSRNKFPQSDSDNLKNWYKTICKNSGVSKTPKKLRSNERRRNKRNSISNLDGIDTTNMLDNNSCINSVEYDSTEDDDFEERSKSWINRDASGKIYEYRYKILQRDKDPIEGFLTPEQMQLIHFLYSNQGKNLPGNKVLEYFPEFTLSELRKIIRAFNITKCSEPFAPHFIESHTEEELSTFRIRYKADRAANLAIKSENRELQEYIKEQGRKISELNYKLNNYKDLFNYTGSEYQVIQIKPEEATKSLVIYLSDMHIGAYITKYALFYHKYDLDEIKCRLYTIVSKFAGRKFNNVVVCNLGDSIDGAGGTTVRGTKLIQNPDGDKEMYKWFMDAMLYFFDLIYANIKFDQLSYCSVGESNHGGNFEYVCQKSLENALKMRYSGLNTCIFEECYGLMKVYDQNIILTHGNDNVNMFKSLPLTINTNPAVENKLTQLLDNKFHLQYAHIIKGDLHQPATTFGNRFRYRSVGCMLGSNDWSGANFGDCKATVDYDIISKFGDIWEGRIVF